MKTLLASLATLLAVSTTGCTFYFGGDGDDDDCAAPTIYDPGYRNPETNTCEAVGGGYGCGDDDDDGYDDYPEPLPTEDYALPDWAQCGSRCEDLPEDACLATEGCRGTYAVEENLDCPPGSLCPEALPWFLGCVGVAPSGPVQGACEGLDAWECSRHDDCASYYTAEQPRFVACGAEPGGGGGGGGGCYSDGDCGDGFTCTANTECLPPPGCDASGVCPDVCYGRCVPATSACDLVDCAPGYTCVEVCTGDPSCPDGACPGTCGAECVPVEPPPPVGPGSCVGDVACDSLPPACPVDTVPGIEAGCWTGFCIPRSACTPSDPGVCFGEALCERVPPACPDGTTPGIVGDCYSGFCIPLSACGPIPL